MGYFELRNSKVLLKTDMDRLYLRQRLEPNIVTDDDNDAARQSLAISMKRIADGLDCTRDAENRKLAVVTMVNAVTDMFRSKHARITLSEAYEIVEAYFESEL